MSPGIEHAGQPERLARDPELAELFERANRDYGRGLDEHAAFQRLSERLEVPKRPFRRWQGALIGAGLGLAAGAAAVWGVLGERAPHVALGPELVIAKRPSPPSPGDAREHDGAEASPGPRNGAPGALPAPAPVATPRAPDPAPPPEEAAPSDTARASATRVQRARPAQPDAARAPASTRDASASTGATPSAVHAAPIARRVNCLDLVRRGEPRAAERCFAEQAAGSGLIAEMALYEMARLRRDVLRDASGALRALEDYRERFPVGTLRNEVNISRVELLSQLGRSREALRESEALLQSASGRERAAELHVLRGNVFRHDLADLAAAILEYARAEPFGGSLGSEATRLRGMSLEAMGDVDGALAAYRRYLNGPEQPRRAEVRRRVEALLQRAARSPAP